MKTPQLYFYLGAMLCLAACSDSVDPISPCADFCADAIHLYRCDASTGKTTLEKCTNGCHEGKCLEAPIVAPTKCTRDTCISDTTLLACNKERGEYTKTHCQSGGRQRRDDIARGRYQCGHANREGVPLGMRKWRLQRRSREMHPTRMQRRDDIARVRYRYGHANRTRLPLGVLKWRLQIQRFRCPLFQRCVQRRRHALCMR